MNKKMKIDNCRRGICERRSKNIPSHDMIQQDTPLLEIYGI